ncbi:MAG: 2-C-methyl-D-erythritol 4-phosphate cytidylyltransferase [Clostridia bacterium]|nr:2-C-methyl-D-erythritol 4-phosphate cytidylyltransferase [Clostridia bacterium]
MVFAGIVAGGMGNRMGTDLPKQYMEINAKPVIIHTIEKFLPYVDEIYIGVAQSWKDYTEKLVEKFNIQNKIRVVIGGENRSATLFAVIWEIKKNHKITKDDIILTHDAVRPFVTGKMIEDNIEICKKCGACGTFIPAVDTMCISKGGYMVEKIPDRSVMYNVQTPQTVKVDILYKLLEKYKNELEQFTDVCGLLCREGVPCGMAQGSRENIKITFPSDIAFAEGIIGK